jgi:hypothetical protein
VNAEPLLEPDLAERLRQAAQSEALRVVTEVEQDEQRLAIGGLGGSRRYCREDRQQRDMRRARDFVAQLVD